MLPHMGVTGRHVRRVTGATRWGLAVLACALAAGGVAGTATAVALGAVLAETHPNE